MSSRSCAAQSAAVISARSYSGIGQVGPAGLTDASLSTGRSRIERFVNFSSGETIVTSTRSPAGASSVSRPATQRRR